MHFIDRRGPNLETENLADEVEFAQVEERKASCSHFQIFVRILDLGLIRQV